MINISKKEIAHLQTDGRYFIIGIETPSARHKDKN